MAARPGDERRPPVGVEHGAGRELVGRGDEHGVRGGQPVDHEAVVVDRRRDGLEPRVAQDRARAGVRRVLDGDAARAGGVQRAAGERERVADAGAHDHVGLGGAHAADAREMRDERAPQRGGSEQVGVLERAGVSLAQHRAQRGRPARAGEQQRVRRAGAQIVARRRGAAAARASAATSSETAATR